MNFTAEVNVSRFVISLISIPPSLILRPPGCIILFCLAESELFHELHVVDVISSTFPKHF